MITWIDVEWLHRLTNEEAFLSCDNYVSYNQFLFSANNGLDCFRWRPWSYSPSAEIEDLRAEQDALVR